MKTNALLCNLLIFSAFAAAGCSQPAPPPAPVEQQVEAQPETGGMPAATSRPTWAVIEALGYLENAEARCEEIGRDVVDRIGRESENTPPEERFDRYIQTEGAAEIRSATAASEAAANLAEAARRKANPATAQVLDDLSRSTRAVCLHIGSLYHSPEDYRLNFVSLVSDYRAARVRFFEVVPVSQRDLQQAQDRALLESRAASSAEGGIEVAPEVEHKPKVLSPEEYARQQAEWKAHQARLEQERAVHESAMNEWRHERSSKPQEPMAKIGMRSTVASVPPSPEALATWHAAWTAKSAPAKAALARYRSLAAARDPGIKTACAELTTSGAAALADTAVLGPPDRALGTQVRAFFSAVKGLGDACQAGMSIEAAFQQKNAEHSLSQVGDSLRGYSLTP